MLNRLGNWLARDRAGRRRGEEDAPVDTGQSTARATGGGSHARTQDRNSTTGTTSNDTFVGRAGGDEAGDTGLSGAEARSDADLDHQGAARRE